MVNKQNFCFENDCTSNRGIPTYTKIRGNKYFIFLNVDDKIENE